MKDICLLKPHSDWWYENNMEVSNDVVGKNYASRWDISPDQEMVFKQYVCLEETLSSVSDILTFNFPTVENNTYLQDNLDLTVNNRYIEDSIVYIRDAFISNQVDLILMSNFSKPSRLHQSNIIKEILEWQSLDREILCAPSDGKTFFEGGDFRFVANWSILFAWYNKKLQSTRNSIEWVKFVQKQFHVKSENLLVIESKWFHIDTVFWILSNENEELIWAVVCNKLVDNFNEIKSFFNSRSLPLLCVDKKYGIPVNDSVNKNDYSWVVNTLNIWNLLLNWGVFDEKTEWLIAHLGIERKTIDVSQFWIKWWWIHCLTNQL